MSGRHRKAIPYGSLLLCPRGRGLWAVRSRTVGGLYLDADGQWVTASAKDRALWHDWVTAVALADRVLGEAIAEVTA